VPSSTVLPGLFSNVWFITAHDSKVTHFTGYSLPGQPAQSGDQA
jgi:hypothetical protein